MTFDQLPWNSDAAGVGALLMIDPALPRDAFGHPYQPLFWFDQHSRPIGLVVDADGHVVAWENNAEGNPLCPTTGLPPSPPAAEQAARDRLVEGHVSPPTAYRSGRPPGASDDQRHAQWFAVIHVQRWTADHSRPNQRLIRLAPNSALAAASPEEASSKVPVGACPLTNVTSTFATWPWPTSR